MSAFRPLLHRRAEVLALVASVAEALPELLGCLQRAFDDAEGLSRSEKVRRGIRRAVGALAVTKRGAISIVLDRIVRGGPAKYGLERVPDRETVTDELKAIARERFTVNAGFGPQSRNRSVSSNLHSRRR